MYALREYQINWVERLRTSFARHRRVLGVSPTGSGKSVAFAYITLAAATKGNRVIITAHRTEITDQISLALDRMGVRHGRIQPGHTMTDDAIQVAMIQTLARRQARIPEPDFLIIDEAHHCVSDSYTAVMNLWPAAKILGVTATPQRLDGRGLGRMFEDMIIGPAVSDLIAGGWLASYRYLCPPERVDLSDVRTRAGDYAVDELAAAVDKAVITGDAIQHYSQYIAPRPAIVFAVRVDHAEHIAQQFIEAGFRAASVDGTMSRADRRDRIEGIGDGRYQVLTSCALISEGLDVPEVSGVILLRPTKSLSLHLQQVGRAMRPKADGSRAIVLDHVGNVHRHGLPDAHRDWTLDDKKRKSKEPSIIRCEQCYRVFGGGPAWRTVACETEPDCAQDIGVDPGTWLDPPGCTVPQDCILLTPSGGGASIGMPKVVDGALEEMTATPTWAGGCNILSARGAEWLALLAHADTRERVDAIRKARGYHWKWTDRIMQARRGTSALNG